MSLNSGYRNPRYYPFNYNNSWYWIAYGIGDIIEFVTVVVLQAKLNSVSQFNPGFSTIQVTNSGFDNVNLLI